MDCKKQYGLIVPKKNQLSAPKLGNVFNNDDESEEEEGTDWVKKALKVENEKNKIKKQTQLIRQKALKEDPTIFQYDEVYDDFKQAEEKEKAVTKQEQKPKYIHNLLKSAALRKKEQELRKDKQIQKEIEAEDAMYPDKERFITSSYKAKLEEMKKFEQDMENEERLEAIGDVMKQKDMTGFYRHLYRQTVDKNELDLGMSSKSYETEKEKEKELEKESEVKKSKKRQYRVRAQEESESESESDHEQEKEKIDLDKKSETKKDEGGSKTPAKQPKITEEVEKPTTVPENKPDENLKPIKKESLEEKENVEVTVEKPKVEKKKVNIWAKRTVGPLLEAARERYLQRKNARLACREI